MKYFLLLPVFALFMVACGDASYETEENDYTDEEETTEVEGDGIHYGEKIDEEGLMDYAELMARLEAQDSVFAKVVAEVSDVCQKKGCWMNVYSPDGSEMDSLFVQFHDYGFFMPLELQGKVIIDGVAYRDVTSVDELRHYAEDANESEEAIAAITEPKEQLKFMATGVKILQ